jgi:hypothetical protein
MRLLQLMVQVFVWMQDKVLVSMFDKTRKGTSKHKHVLLLAG